MHIHISRLTYSNTIQYLLIQNGGELIGKTFVEKDILRKAGNYEERWTNPAT